MKNHRWSDGKLLQTNKKYSHLKLKQKEKIHQWMYDAYKAAYQRLGKYPDTADDEEILQDVMDRISEADIWIPYGEVAKHYRSIRGNLRKRLGREHLREQPAIVLEPLDIRFSVCKVTDYSGIDLTQPFCFTGATDEEKSLVCPESFAPENTTARDDGWSGFRITGQLDFSLIGILAKISKVLASNGIGIFAISTYNTDYILTKEENFEKALKALKNAGYGTKDGNKAF